MLSDDGHIKGVRITATTSTRIVTDINKLEITSSGLQYLKENSMMIKAYNIFKEAGNWLPLFSLTTLQFWRVVFGKSSAQFCIGEIR